MNLPGSNIIGPCTGAVGSVDIGSGTVGTSGITGCFLGSVCGRGTVIINNIFLKKHKYNIVIN